MKKKTICILSGGVDSTTLLHSLIKKEKDEVLAITFDYGQRHIKELECAKYQASFLDVNHTIIDLSVLKPVFKGCALTDDIEIPCGHYEDKNMKARVVPNRNMIMLSIAIGCAISENADRVAYAAHAGDHAIYPDCRVDFVNAMKDVAKVCHYEPIEIYAPFLNLSKVKIVKKGHDFGVDFSKTWSCYKGEDSPCGICGTCIERLEAFKNQGLEDPLAQNKGENNE